jgi:hypothetical protein
MKIVILFTLILLKLLIADGREERRITSTEIKIVEFVLLAIDRDIKVYADESRKIELLKKSRLKRVDNCSKASIVYASSLPPQCRDKPLFTDSYRTFRDSSNAIGAFYWRKGRPNILFLKPRLSKFNLKVSKKLRKYLLDEL